MADIGKPTRKIRIEPEPRPDPEPGREPEREQPEKKPAQAVQSKTASPTVR